MSWDVMVARFPDDILEPEDLPDGWAPEPLGTVASVRDQLTAAVPGLAVAPDGELAYDGDGVHLSASLDGADDDPCPSLFLIFHGSSAAAGVAIAITEALSARAIETGSGGFLERATAEEGWQEWAAYRDVVVGRAPLA